MLVFASYWLPKGVDMWANFKKLSKKVNYRNGAWFFFGVAMASFRIDAIDGYTYLFVSAIFGLISFGKTENKDRGP